MVLSNSEMSKNISFHVALRARGSSRGWHKGAGLWGSHRGGAPPPLVFNEVKEENLGTAFSCFSLPKRGCGEMVGTMES